MSNDSSTNDAIVSIAVADVNHTVLTHHWPHNNEGGKSNSASLSHCLRSRKNRASNIKSSDSNLNHARKQENNFIDSNPTNYILSSSIYNNQYLLNKETIY